MSAALNADTRNGMSGGGGDMETSPMPHRRARKAIIESDPDDLEETGRSGGDSLVLPLSSAMASATATTFSMDTDISQLEAPTFTTLDRGPSQKMMELSWDHKVNLIGKGVVDPMIHNCDKCAKPILIYGRMIPCKHVFCYKCAQTQRTQCPRCKDKVSRVEQAGLGSIFMCAHGGSRYGSNGCRRTCLSQRDLQAHVHHRHMKQQQSSNAAASAAAAVAAAAAAPSSLPLVPSVAAINAATAALVADRKKTESLTTYDSGSGRNYYATPPPPPPQNRSSQQSNLITVPIQDSSGPWSSSGNNQHQQSYTQPPPTFYASASSSAGGGASFQYQPTAAVANSSTTAYDNSNGQWQSGGRTTSSSSSQLQGGGYYSRR